MDTTQTLAFRRMITESVKKSASDLHLSVGSYPMTRIDGNLKPMEEEEIMSEQSLRDIVDALVPQEKRDVLEQQRDIVFTSDFDGKIRAKIHIYYQEHFPSISLRFLSTTPKTLRELGCPQGFERFTALTGGLLIIAGPQNSGKTTLAAALLEHINRTRSARILTLETPLEYDLLSNKSIVNQREVGVDVKTFEDGLDFAQKDDVDVLFLSEFDKPSVIKRGLDLANAGVYVITIMNTDSAMRTIERIITGFEPHEEQHIRGLLANVLEGIIIQELIPQIGGGYLSVHEVLLNNPSVKTLITSNRIQQIDQVIKSSRGEGMMSFDHEIASLVRGQKISLEHAKEYAKDRETLDLLIRG